MNATPKPLPAFDDLFERDWQLPTTPEQYQRDDIADAQTDDDEPEDLG